MQWFTADLHLGHTNIIKYCNRPFSSVEEMDKIIIDNIFSCIKSKDILYVLGDISLNRNITLNFLKKLFNSEIKYFLIIGNHDNFPKDFNVPKIIDIKINEQKITLCHYAMRTWNCSCHGAWQLYAHSHGTLKPVGKQWDVGVDNNNFKPLSFEQIVEIMKLRENNEDYLTKEK